MAGSEAVWLVLEKGLFLSSLPPSTSDSMPSSVESISLPVALLLLKK